MPWKPHLSLSSQCCPLQMPACSKQVPVLCLSLEDHSWQGQAHQQRQRGQNMGRVHKKWSVLGAEGRTSETRADAGMTYWHKMTEALEAQGWHSVCLSSFHTPLWHGLCHSGQSHSLLIVRPWDSPGKAILYGRSVGCPFPAPGWLKEALE